MNSTKQLTTKWMIHFIINIEIPDTETKDGSKRLAIEKREGYQVGELLPVRVQEHASHEE